jgi:hypothetical protein
VLDLARLPAVTKARGVDPRAQAVVDHPRRICCARLRLSDAFRAFAAVAEVTCGSLMEYPVLQLPGGRIPENREPLGSKKKVWLRDPTGREPRVLFKYNRGGTGEDWSEKIAAELAQLLGLPHSKVELAMFEGHRGAALFEFTMKGQVDLVHGNELLEFVNPEYPSQQRYGAIEHTVAAVLKALARPAVGLPEAPRPLPEGVTDAFGVFVGYLLLDAWIGNIDRHHENWGLLWHRHEAPGSSLVLAPSYDHASSLGRELSDRKRTQSVRPSQGSRVEHYARRAESAFYAGHGQKGPLSTWAAFEAAANYRPSAGAAWLERLRNLPDQSARAAVEAVPDGHMSRIAKDFACALLDCNAKLLGAR